MRKNWVVILCVLILGIMMGLSASALTAETHPQIRAAQNDLAQAKSHLQRANTDYGGHKVKAIEHIDKAQDELRDALEWDRKH